GSVTDSKGREVAEYIAALSRESGTRQAELAISLAGHKDESTHSRLFALSLRGENGDLAVSAAQVQPGLELLLPPLVGPEKPSPSRMAKFVLESEKRIST